MGRILLFMIAASLAWYLVRSVVGRNRSTPRSIPEPKRPASEIPPQDVPKARAEDQNVRDARFRDL